jgi:hypothetical protein
VIVVIATNTGTGVSSVQARLHGMGERERRGSGE